MEKSFAKCTICDMRGAVQILEREQNRLKIVFLATAWPINHEIEIGGRVDHHIQCRPSLNSPRF
jgi:hypothetical protein